MAVSTHRWALLLVVAVALALPRASRAQGDVPSDVDKAYTFAVENFDLGDVAAARDQLQGAMRSLERAGLADHPAAIPTRLLLGVAHARLGADADARSQFEAALSIDETAALPDGYADDQARALFAEALSAVTAPAPAAIDCDALRGIAHDLVEKAEAGVDIEITAHVGSELAGATLALQYAHEDDGDQFASAPLSAAGGCAHRGTIPADAVRAGSLRYYIAARNEAGRLLASNGSATSPFLIAVRAPAAAGDVSTDTGEGGEAVENEVPDAIDPARPPGTRPRSGCAGCGVGAGSPDAAWLALAAALLVTTRRRRRR